MQFCARFVRLRLFVVNSTAATPTPSVRLSLVSGTCVSLASRISRLGGVSRQLSNMNDSAQRLLMVASNSTQPSASMRSHFGCPVITTSTASAAGGASGSMGTWIRASPVVQRNARSSVCSSPWKPAAVAPSSAPVVSRIKLSWPMSRSGSSASKRIHRLR